MTLDLIIAGSTLGLISSFHCVGMCGPIAFALPVQSLSPVSKMASTLSYHFGRISTYTLMGGLFGLLGRQVYLAGFQRWFSISLGLIILILLLRYYQQHKRMQSGWMSRFQGKLLQIMGSLLKQPRPAGFFLLGMANGLLPCGMVYLAIAGALSTNQTLDGMAFMASFGAGTLPTLLALNWFGHMASISLRNRIRRLTPYVIALTGILLILRGLNLGIPYISPVLESARGAAVSCH
jgi:sulfite exporter TauE/SafE